MSDDDKNGAWNANEGITLPGSIAAIYNINISPLYFMRDGGVVPSDNGKNVNVRGIGGAYWALNPQTTSQSYNLSTNSNNQYIFPSRIDVNEFAFPLRCLVSTNNK